MDQVLDPARVQRALTQQRIRLLDTIAPGQYLIQGSQDNNWTVHLDGTHVECTCPDNQNRGAVCKHLIFVLIRVLHKPITAARTVRQLLTDVPVAPPAPVECSSDILMRIWQAHPDWKQPRYVEGAECAVCFEAMDPTREYIWWCRTTCGNTMHRLCIEQCMAHGIQTCPHCRHSWRV